MTNRNQLAVHERRSLAVRMVRAGMRTSIVSSSTHVSERHVREIWREVWGVGPASGQLPNPRTVCRTSEQLRQASLVMAIYRHYAQTCGLDIEQVIAMDALLDAIEVYREEVAKPLIDSNQAWVIARALLRSPIDEPEVSLHTCDGCQRPYLILRDDPFRGCPFCVTKARAKSRAQPARKSRVTR